MLPRLLPQASVCGASQKGVTIRTSIDLQPHRTCNPIFLETMGRADRDTEKMFFQSVEQGGNTGSVSPLQCTVPSSGGAQAVTDAAQDGVWKQRNAIGRQSCEAAALQTKTRQTSGSQSMNTYRAPRTGPGHDKPTSRKKNKVVLETSSNPPNVTKQLRMTSAISFNRRPDGHDPRWERTSGGCMSNRRCQFRHPIGATARICWDCATSLTMPCLSGFHAFKRGSSVPPLIS